MKLAAPDGASGKRAKCPKCGHVMGIPEPSAQAPPGPVVAAPDPAPDPAPGVPPYKSLKPATGAFKHLTSQLEKRTGAKAVTTSGRALVVDDEPDTLATVSDLLAHHGFEVLQASNGEEAIKMAFEHKPDVVLVDVMLPGMNGFEVCRRLKDASTPGRGTYDAHTPVVMLSAKTKNRDIQYAKSVGADEYVKKPINPLKLYKKIDRAMNR